MERLGRYQILRPLAAGGMGEIFLAEHTGLSGFAKRVALKQISPAFAKNPSYLELFLNEARVGSFLNHPNIVHIFDVGHQGDSLWLVMEYVDGVDLKRVIRRTALAEHLLDPPILGTIMLEVLCALEEAHAGGPTRREPIIHRDLSPENILIARSGAIKVLDFGLAKWAPGSHAVPSMEGTLIFGKVRYMPPEQLKGKLIDVRADLWALGAVMHEALSGELPFGSGSANDVLRRILAGPPKPATGGRHPAIEAIVKKALTPDPTGRYQTAAEMREDLARYLETVDSRLPFERLRRILRPGSPVADSEAERASLDGDRVSAIDLSIAKRCGKCGGGFQALFLDGMIVDRCAECRGTWLDQAEFARIAGGEPLGVTEVETDFARAPLDGVIGSCPTCRVGLRVFAVPDHPAAIEVCPNCYGVWLDHGEIELLRGGDVVRWLRTIVESLRSTGLKAS